MANRSILPAKKFSGKPRVPGDKSVSHRGLIFGALASGQTEIHNLLESGDVNSTASCLRQLGAVIEKKGSATFVQGLGSAGFRSPKEILDCGNSGTTMRLLMGVLSGCFGLQAELTGDASLIKRPMKRVAEPLRQMGAQMSLTQDDFAPLKISGSELHAIDYELKIASAQIKTAIVLAALLAKGRTRIHGEIHSRDHTERLLAHFGVQIESNSKEIWVQGGQKFKSSRLNVPGDPSTAAFWLAGACLVPNTKFELDNISLNPTRTGFIRALQKMGAKLELQVTEERPEPIGTIRISAGELRGIQIGGAEIPSLIDELPMLAVLATQAHGVTEVTGAEELRVKETDRIEAVAVNLRAMGAKIETRPDGFRIEGPQKLRGATINSFHDHRIAMAFSIATLIASSGSEIQGAECVSISYPAFFDTLDELTQ
jgi:3-phosphoshikimate 1-carboxyvinyltransferase